MNCDKFLIIFDIFIGDRFYLYYNQCMKLKRVDEVKYKTKNDRYKHDMKF